MGGEDPQGLEQGLLLALAPRAVVEGVVEVGLSGAQRVLVGAHHLQVGHHATASGEMSWTRLLGVAIVLTLFPTSQ